MWPKDDQCGGQEEVDGAAIGDLTCQRWRSGTLTACSDVQECSAYLYIMVRAHPPYVELNPTVKTSPLSVVCSLYCNTTDRTGSQNL